MLEAERLNIKSVDGSSIEATMSFEHTEAKVLLTYLLFLLETPGFLSRFSFKQNSQGRINCKLQMKKRLDWRTILVNLKVSVVSFLTKTKGLNGS